MLQLIFILILCGLAYRIGYNKGGIKVLDAWEEETNIKKEAFRILLELLDEMEQEKSLKK